MDASTYFRQRRQGDIVETPARGQSVASDHVIVSQSCDVVLPKRECVLIAPLVEVADPVRRRGALNRENPQYIGLRSEAERFVDLERIEWRDKSELVGCPARPGIDPADDQAVRDFGLAVGRWFGRFAFPDEVQPWLAPLQKQIREKYTQPQSPLGQVLHQVAEIRIQAESWATASRVLTVHVIVRAGVLPVVSESDEPQTGVAGGRRALAVVAAELIDARSPARFAALWYELAWLLADLCVPRGTYASDPIVMDAVSRVDAMLWTDEDFPLSRVRKSEQLDVDFLSEPTPL